MSQKPMATLSDEAAIAIAIEFENREFTHEELVTIAATRQRTPRPIEGRPSTGDDAWGDKPIEDGAGHIAPPVETPVRVLALHGTETGYSRRTTLRSSLFTGSTAKPPDSKAVTPSSGSTSSGPKITVEPRRRPSNSI